MSEEDAWEQAEPLANSILRGYISFFFLFLMVRLGQVRPAQASSGQLRPAQVSSGQFRRPGEASAVRAALGTRHSNAEADVASAGWCRAPSAERRVPTSGVAGGDRRVRPCDRCAGVRRTAYVTTTVMM